MNKYNAQKVEAYGMKFDSLAEYDRYEELRLLERAGQIKNLRHHIRIPLIQPIKGRKLIDQDELGVFYEADFIYSQVIDGEERMVIEDVKGDTSGEAYKMWVVKRKLLKTNYPEYIVKEIIDGYDITSFKVEEAKRKEEEKRKARERKHAINKKSAKFSD